MMSLIYQKTGYENFLECGVFMKTIATIMQLTRSLLILTPAEYDKSEGGLQIGGKKGAGIPNSFSIPQIFELNDSLKDHPYEKTEELAAFVKRCAESVSMEIGDLFVCIEDEDVLITKEYKHPVSKQKLLSTFAHVEAEAVLHADVNKYTILNFEYGQQYGKASKSEDVSASLFAMNTEMLASIRVDFEREGLHVVKITPPIAGMLYTSKVDLNSATKAIALISMDFAATRLVVLHNGAPIFQQSFSSVLEDIAEMFSLEFGISKMGAIDLIRKEGLGVCNKCHSAQTRKQTMTMLDNAAGEILRNLRMVISTQRLDIDQIVLCDVLSKLPSIGNYCRSVGLTAPMEKVTNIFTGSTVPPTVSGSASEKGYDASSFITFNGLLSMPIQEANLISGESNIAAVIAAQGSSKVGKMITSGVAIVAAVWMAAVGIWWLSLEIRQNNDNSEMESDKYDRAKQLIADEAEYTTKLANMVADLQILPRNDIKSKDVISNFFTQVVEKVNGCDALDYNHESNLLSTRIQTTDFDAYDELKLEIDDTGYFVVQEAFEVTRVVDDDEAIATGLNTYIDGNLNLSVSEKTLADAEAAAASEETASEGQEAQESSATEASAS